MGRKKVEIMVVKVGFVILSILSAGKKFRKLGFKKKEIANLRDLLARRRRKILKIVLRIVFKILFVEA
jgi:hypothetical protein